MCAQTHTWHIQLQLQRLSKQVQWWCKLNQAYVKPIQDQVNTCLSSIHGWMPQQWMPRAQLFISLYLLGPTDNADPPTSLQMRPFYPKREAEKLMPSAMCCCPSFFLSHRRAPRFQTIRRKVCRTQWTVPRAYRVKYFGPRTQLCRSSLNCPN